MTRRYIYTVAVPDDNLAEMQEMLEDVCGETQAVIVAFVVDGQPAFPMPRRGDSKAAATAREAAEYAYAKRLADELRHAYDTLHRLTPDSIDVGRVADLLRKVGRL